MTWGTGNGGDIQVHLVIPKNFNDAQQIADQFKDAIPVILNLQGSNTLNVAVWSQTDAGAKLTTLRLISYASYESGFDFAGIDGKQLQPSWQDRSQYA